MYILNIFNLIMQLETITQLETIMQLETISNWKQSATGNKATGNRL
jgi:hypothetical protein